MLSYVIKAMTRNPRRALAAIAGLALAIGLLADAALFVDGSGSRMTRRAVAQVTIDMQAAVNTPLASTLSLAASVSPRPPLFAGQAIKVTLVAANTALVAAHNVTVDAPLSVLLNYQLGSTTRDGVRLPDIPPSEDNPFLVKPLDSPLNLGTIAPGGKVTVEYGAVTRQQISSAADLLTATVRSTEDPAPTRANGPTAAKLPALADKIRRIPEVGAAQPFGLIDLPTRSVAVPGQVFDVPIKLVGLDPSYGEDIPIVSFARGTYTAGTAFLSLGLAEQLHAEPGTTVSLFVPGRPVTSPVALPVGAVADLTKADQLFASRMAGGVGDFIAAPYVVGVDIATFQNLVMPALRVDAAAAVPVLKAAPVLEIHANVLRRSLARDPHRSLRTTVSIRRSIERSSPGDLRVIDNVSTSLDRARIDSTLAKILFSALGFPGTVLAGYLAFYGGGLLAETERRERALLQARGFSPSALSRALVYQTAAITVLGILSGLGIAFLVAKTIFPAEFSPRGTSFAVSILTAVVVAVLIGAFAIYIPARRALRGDIAQSQQAVQTSARPAWLRGRVDFLLLGVVVVVSLVFTLAGGFRPNPKAHDESIAKSFYILLAPWCLWLGGAMLAARGLLALCARLASDTAPVDFRQNLVGKTILRSVTRRPRAVTAGIIMLTLTVAFGTSLAVFVATFHSEQEADARFVVGGDVRVTPSFGQALPADLQQRLMVPGVRAMSPVVRDPNVIVGTDVVLFAAIDPDTFEQVAPLHAGFFTDTTPREAMRAMARDPKGVLVDRETAIDFNFQKGDTIKVQLPSPALGQPIVATLHVVGTVIQFPSFPLGLDLVANLEHYQEVTGSLAPSYFLLDTDGHRSTNAKVMRSVGEALGQSLPARLESTARTANQDQTSVAGLSLTGFGRFEGIYTLLIASLAITILVTTLLLQRGTERGTMRAMGLGRRNLQALLLGEVVVVVLVSVVAGAVLGVPMSYMFAQILRRVFVVPPTYVSIPASEALLLVGIIAATVAVAALIIAAAIRRLRLVELLRTD